MKGCYKDFLTKRSLMVQEILVYSINPSLGISSGKSWKTKLNTLQETFVTLSLMNLTNTLCNIFSNINMGFLKLSFHIHIPYRTIKGNSCYLLHHLSKSFFLVFSIHAHSFLLLYQNQNGVLQLFLLLLLL